MDNTAPSVTLSLPGGTYVTSDGEIVRLTGHADDNLSGLSRVQISIDRRPWREVELTAPGEYPLTSDWEYEWAIGEGAQGEHPVAVRALDRAGNQSGVQESSVIVDVVPPSDDLTRRLNEEEPPVRQASPDITFYGRANDAGRVPLPPRPATLEGDLDALDDATVWLEPDSIREDDDGVSLTWLGDINGDGRADLAVGLPASEDGAGRVAVLHGRGGDWPVPLDTEAIASSPSSFVGASGAAIGAHVAPAGDVDGDGFDDLLIGDPANDRAFLIFGRPSYLGTNLVLDGPHSGSRVLFTTPTDYDRVAPAGDVDGDGYADFFLSGDDQAALILGHQPPWHDTVDAVDEAAALISLPADGQTVGVGDVDSDQLDDFVVTDPTDGLGNGVGLYLYAGSEDFVMRDNLAIDPPADSVAFFGSEGFSTVQVVALGDVNGDDLADFIYRSGEAPRLVLGRASGGWDVSLEFSAYTPPPAGFLAAPGDVNDDGLNDLLLGTTQESAYLVLGTPDLPATPNIQATFAGIAGAASAPYAAGADLNCDRSSDLLRGTPNASFGWRAPA